jgi:SpoVK/Ycf46/Vps4 family AAA+-type ATPase
MSKWMGEGEKMVKALFAVARAKQPSVIFIDEVDSILSQRREGENEGTIRVKNEILVQMDGAAAADADERLLVVGATNRPQELDDAARRRLQKRLMIPLPDGAARTQMVTNGLVGVSHVLSAADVALVVEGTDGYSGSDMAGLCREAAMEPLRDEGMRERLLSGETGDVRAVTKEDFDSALCQVRPSVSEKELRGFEEWNRLFGSFANAESKRQALRAQPPGNREPAA